MPSASATHGHLLGFVGGAIATFYGRHLAHVLLYAAFLLNTTGPSASLKLKLLEQMHELCAVARATWRAMDEIPRFRGATSLANLSRLDGRLAHLRDAHHRARTSGNIEEAEVLEHEIADAEHAAMDSAGASIIARACSSSCASEAVDLLKALLASFSELADRAVSNGTARIGVRVNLADEIMHSINDSFGMMMWRTLQRLRDYSVLVDRLLSEPHSRRWTERVVTTLCQSVGIGLAFYIEGFFFAVANAVWGAELMGRSANGVLASRGLNVQRVHPLVLHRLKWVVAVGGLAFQFFGRGRKLPSGVLRAAFLVPLLAEGWLRTATLAFRGPFRAG